MTTSPLTYQKKTLLPSCQVLYYQKSMMDAERYLGKDFEFTGRIKYKKIDRITPAGEETDIQVFFEVEHTYNFILFKVRTTDFIYERYFTFENVTVDIDVAEEIVEC